MNFKLVLAMTAAMALCVNLASSLRANPVNLSDLPEAVQKAIKAQAEGGKLGEIDKVDDDDGVSYEVSLTKGGKDRDFSVDEEGALLSEEVYLAETPPAVQKTIKANVGQATLDSIDKEYDEDGVSYEVSLTTKDGKERSFTVATDGKLLSMQVGIEEVPPAPRKVIEEHSAGAKLGDIFRETDEGGTYYDVEMTKNGKSRGFTVAASGKLESVQVYLGETPPPVQKTIRAHLAGAKIVSIDKVFGDKPGEFTFEVEAQKDGKDLDFSVNSKGGFMGVEK